jgi:hypothetical protein
MVTQIPQRSSDLLAATERLELTGYDLNDRIILTMDAMVEWQRVEALGWWEHTSDWDLMFVVKTVDGTIHELTGNPGFVLELDGKTYLPWELLEHATELRVHGSGDDIHSSARFHVTDAMVYEGPEDMDGREVSMSFDLSEIAQIFHTQM